MDSRRIWPVSRPRTRSQTREDIEDGPHSRSPVGDQSDGNLRSVGNVHNSRHFLDERNALSPNEGPVPSPQMLRPLSRHERDSERIAQTPEALRLEQDSLLNGNGEVDRPHSDTLLSSQRTLQVDGVTGQNADHRSSDVPFSAEGQSRLSVNEPRHSHDSLRMRGFERAGFEVRSSEMMHNNGNDVEGSGDVQRHPSSMWSKQGEPKVSVPLYNGKVEWKVFWLQFDLISKRFGWTCANKLDRLVSLLRDDALAFYADLPAIVRDHLPALVEAFSRRFDDRRLPETYRASLTSVVRGKTETLSEFASRVRKNVNKAYPGIYGTELLDHITIDHLLKGLTDRAIAYDVKTKRPQTVEHAIDLIQWHEACKGLHGFEASVRVVNTGDEPKTSVRRLGGKSYVDEDRLIQFGRELTAAIAKELNKSGHKQTSNTEWVKNATCFCCGEVGHLKKECPNAKTDESPNASDNQ